MINIGKYKHRIVIQRKVRSQDSSGDTIETWETYATVWAAYEPVSVRDFIASRSEQSEVASRFEIRQGGNADDVDANMRILFRGKTHDITGVLPDKDSGLEYFTLPCKQGVNQG